MDKATTDRLSRVHPLLKAKVAQLLMNLAAFGKDVRVVQGLRTFAEQDALFAKRPKVTNARGGQSNHNYGLAVDLCPFSGGIADWNDLATFNLIGREAKKLGLEWGGDWKFVDKPHVQLKGLSIKECFALYKSGGLDAVWTRMFQIAGGAKPAIIIPGSTDLLEFGDKGAEVTKLQQQLQTLGFLRPHEIDGDFGKITKNAVIGFQRRNNLTADGIVGDGTKAKLAAALAKKKETFADLKQSEINPEIPAAADVHAPIINQPEEAKLKTPSKSLQTEQPPPDETTATETKKQETTVEETPTGKKSTTVDETIFKADTKEIAPPEKEGSTKTVVATTAAGWSLAALPMLIWGFVQSAYQQGQIDVKAVFDLVVKFYSENTRYIFYSIFAVIGFLAMKKLLKQFSFIVQMIINAIPWLHDIKLVPKDKSNAPLKEEK